MSYSGFVPNEKRAVFAEVLGTLRSGEVTGGVGTLRAERRVGTAVGEAVSTLSRGSAVGALVGSASVGTVLGELVGVASVGTEVEAVGTLSRGAAVGALFDGSSRMDAKRGERRGGTAVGSLLGSAMV